MKSENSTAQIKCTSDSSMHFYQSQSIHITHLEFIGCGGNQVRHIEEFVIEDAKFEGQENSGTVLEVIKTTVQIVNSTFLSNRKGLFRECSIFHPEYGCGFDRFIGGAIIATNSTVEISQSRFEDNKADLGGAIFAEQDSIINMSDNVFVSNEAIIRVSSRRTTITIIRNDFQDKNARFGGVLASINSTITIEANQFHDNYATDWGGVLSSWSSTMTIKANQFHDNYATNSGGVLHSWSSTMTIKASHFHANNATYDGGVLYSSSSSTITIEASEFHDNYAGSAGGVLYSDNSTIIIEGNRFHDNSALTWGGVLLSDSSTITIEGSGFYDNNARRGGVLNSDGSTITIEGSGFHHNNATDKGGVLESDCDIITIAGSNFTNNVSPIGAIIYAASRPIIYSFLLIDNNKADRYAVIYLSDSEFIGNDLFFSSNVGSLVAFNSNITFTGYATFVNNTPSQTDSGDFQEGGAITLFQSNVFFDGECNLEHNYAVNGGAMHSTESKHYVNGNLTIAHNTATGHGGGVYLSTSELNCQQKSILVLWNNTASHKGGGLHAISSSIKAASSMAWRQYTVTRINITGNAAERGGGLSLEANARLYILKYVHYHYNIITFTANSADYGGAIHVDDNTNSGICASSTETECFFQVLALYSHENQNLGTQCMHFSQNHANISGSTLYGGLLDRCAVSPVAEVHKKYPRAFKDRGGGIAYFKNVSTLVYVDFSRYHNNIIMEIVSDPVRVCLCFNIDQNNGCTHQYYTESKKGQAFKLSVVAVDQVGQPVSATIQTSLHFTESGLAEGQLARKIPAECTNLTFNVVSRHISESLSLYASDGPCKDTEFSRATVEIHFLPCSCPIGLQVSGINSTNCTCDCHSNISQYMDHCDSHTGLLTKQPQTRAWISYINDTELSGYLVYPNCPFDYCLSTSPLFGLNEQNGINVQCAFNRSSLLCGSCQSGLSLSLGSSRCLPCPSYWPALLIASTIAAIIAGIALVVLLLILNMTVAVGTLNGLIFYVNVVHANKSILLPFQTRNFITMFISWLNLELGIDTCYFPGMDTYFKIWLQLAFPAYVILLVVLVIIISSYSTKFSNLIGKKDPVATLAALILLSYAKLLEICFKSLSVGILEYPDGSSEMQWLPDATVKYLSGKNILLFIAAVLILLVGLVYTALLFSWQWLLYLPRWKIFSWSWNPKIQTFIETYHKPYTPKHRYWTGLLLIIRVVLYLVAATNISNDPTIAFTAISFTVCCIFALKQFFGSRLYRKWPVDVLETFFYFNILSFVIFTWYSLDSPASDREAAAYISVIITFIALLLIILYHVYTYTSVFSSKIHETKLSRIINRQLTDADPRQKPERDRSPPPSDDDTHRFNKLLDVIDYKVLREPVKPTPTQSVVEMHHLRTDLAAPDPKEVANSLHIPGAAEAAEAAQVKEKEAVSQV